MLFVSVLSLSGSLNYSIKDGAEYYRISEKCQYSFLNNVVMLYIVLTYIHKYLHTYLYIVHILRSKAPCRGFWMPGLGLYGIRDKTDGVVTL